MISGMPGGGGSGCHQPAGGGGPASGGGPPGQPLEKLTCVPCGPAAEPLDSAALSLRGALRLRLLSRLPSLRRLKRDALGSRWLTPFQIGFVSLPQRCLEGSHKKQTAAFASSLLC